jgi:hypothetical protein
MLLRVFEEVRGGVRAYIGNDKFLLWKIGLDADAIAEAWTWRLLGHVD